MPWSNQGGGPWGSGGGGSKGPWGGGPQSSGPTPPDLEELLRRSQDKLRRVLPGGGLGARGRLVGVPPGGRGSGVVPRAPRDPRRLREPERPSVREWKESEWMSGEELSKKIKDEGLL